MVKKVSNVHSFMRNENHAIFFFYYYLFASWKYPQTLQRFWKRSIEYSYNALIFSLCQRLCSTDTPIHIFSILKTINAIFKCLVICSHFQSIININIICFWVVAKFDFWFHFLDKCSESSMFRHSMFGGFEVRYFVFVPRLRNLSVKV